jgi:hypothetical protein
MWATLFLWFPVAETISVLLRDRARYVLISAVAVPSVAMIVIAYLRANLIRCPDCGRLFSVSRRTECRHRVDRGTGTDARPARD